MKKFTYLLLIAAIWYLAGLYRQTDYMKLAIALLLFGIVMFVLSRYLRSKTDIKLPEQKLVAFKGIETPFSVTAINKCRLPVSRYKLKFIMRYKNSKKKYKKKFFGSASPAKSNSPQSHSETEAQFYFTAPYCGIIEMNTKKLRIYDYLSIFSCSKKVHNTTQIVVIPVPVGIKLDLTGLTAYEGEPLEEDMNEKYGEDRNNIRQVREYRPGDLRRHIHRNYSARMQELWIKEYHKENDLICHVVLNNSSDNVLSEDKTDAFYEISYSILNSLMKHEFLMIVHYYDSTEAAVISRPVSDAEQLTELFASLYLSAPCSASSFSEAVNEMSESAVVINQDLSVFCMGKPVYKFSSERFRNELETVVIEL